MDFWIGAIRVSGKINDLKALTEELNTLAVEASNNLSDFCFAVNTTYQEWHGLDQDDWNGD